MRFLQRLIANEFIRFCLVGVSGFCINFLLLRVLYQRLHISIFVAQLISSEIALFSNFLLHHHWTYRRKQVTKSISTLLWQFHASSWAAILGSAVMVGGMVNWLHTSDLVALVIASAVAMGWNFSWSKFVIWRHEHEEKEEGATSWISLSSVPVMLAL